MPARACVGAILGLDEPAYLLYGPRLGRRVVYLSVDGDVVQAAYRAGLFYVVISTGPNRYVARQFRSAGWTVAPARGLLAARGRAERRRRASARPEPARR